MKTRLSTPSRLWLAVLTVALANTSCHSKTGPDGKLDTYTISGVARSSAEQSPIEGAIIQATGTGASGVWTPRSAVTDAAGRYVITGLRDSVTVTSTKVGFVNASANLQLTQDALLDFTMMKGVAEGGDLVIDKTISGSIGSSDEKCDPNWDQNAPCRRFSFIPDAVRVYQFVLTFDCRANLPPSLGSALELHLLTSSGLRLFTSSKASPITKDISLAPGVYEVRLMAYYVCDRFDLTVK